MPIDVEDGHLKAARLTAAIEQYGDRFLADILWSKTAVLGRGHFEASELAADDLRHAAINRTP